MKVALVYDWLDSWGGAERVLLLFHKIFPTAPIYTSIYNSKRASWAKTFQVKASFLQKMPLAKKQRKYYLPFFPAAFENFNFDQYDLVISIASFAAKGIITKPHTRHICYLLTPTRFLWNDQKDYFNNNFQKKLSEPIFRYLKKWDKIAAQRPDQIIGISKNIARRCQKYYQRRVSQIIYPPVDTKRFHIKEQGFEKKRPYPFFLLVSRLEPYKKTDLAIKAFNDLGWNLKIIGQGSQLKKLKKMAKPNIEFLGHLTDKQILDYYQTCRGVIYPQEEDFGLVPLEAQACGKPVIAYKKGGTRETIIKNKTGAFFKPQNEKALVKALLKFNDKSYNKKSCRRNAEKFNEKKFTKAWEKLVNQNA